MQKLFPGAAVLVACLFAPAAYAQPGDLTLFIADGRVTLIARDVPLRQILAEWARVGQTRIINAEKVVGPPLTLELRDEPEVQALATLLRSVSGYVVAPRTAGIPGPSVYDRIMILPTSRPPPASPMNPAPFARPGPMQPVMPPVDDDQAEQGVVPPGGMLPQGMVPQGMVPPPAPQGVPGSPYPPGYQPGQQPVTTLDRPGQLPPPPSFPGNPYQPGQQPGVVPGAVPGVQGVPGIPPAVPGGPPAPGAPPRVPGGPGGGGSGSL